MIIKESNRAPADEVGALLTEFLWRLDHSGYGSVAELFVEDGTMRTPRLELRGRAQISEWFAQRSGREIKTHHTWSNLRIEDAKETELTLTTRTVTLQAPVSSDASTAHVIVGETRDILHKVATGSWRFASRKLTVFFAGSLG